MACCLAALAAGAGCKGKNPKAPEIFGSPGGGAGGDTLSPVGEGDLGFGDLPERPGAGDITYLSGPGYDFPPVLFAYDSANLRAPERAKVEAVAQALTQEPAIGVIVEGHCDERGSREYNLALGERRALSVRSYLTGLGVDGSRIQTKSFGEEMPAALGHDEGSWSQNRRGEFKLFK